MSQGFTTRPELQGTFGMVTSTHWLASAAGMAVLEEGGNAFDAAVATGLVLQVVEPHLNGPGGEAPIIAFSAERGDVVVIAGQGPAPAGASIEAFAKLGLDLVPGTGLLPACVPGAFGAWMAMLRDLGTMPLRAVMRFAIGYAGYGYPLVPRISDAIRGVESLFRSEWPTSAEVYLAGGVPAPGSLFRNPVLAQTYERIVTDAEAAAGDREAQIDRALSTFYEGFVAETVDRFVRVNEVMDSSARRNPGFLTGSDLAGWRAPLERPATYEYRGNTVCKTGPWGQGPVFLQQLALLSGFDVGGFEPGGADYVHTVVECAKLAFADREAFYGDPDLVDVPLAELLSDDYARQRRDLVGPDASLELRPGEPGGRTPRLPTPPDATAAAPGSGEPTLVREGDTCHLDVVDRWGNMVSATPSGGWLQSSPALPGLGFCLGTRAQTFWLEPGLPNSLEPGKRPRTTLSPTLVTRGGEPRLAFGTPGGDNQDQWSLAFFLEHIDFGSDLQQAIDAATFHTDHFPSSFYPRPSAPGHLALESRFRPDVVDELRARGHRVAISGPWSLGRVGAVARDEGGALLRAAADPRGVQGYAAGR